MAGFGGLSKAYAKHLTIYLTEGGDCPRCGGESQPSTMAGYLVCVSCSHEWADPDFVEEKIDDIPTYHRDAELIEQFKGCRIR